jgi:KUP system potassium uptake protein
VYGLNERDCSGWDRYRSVLRHPLIITVSIKYGVFVMRADNHGEGGILALMAMTGAHWSRRGRWLIVTGLFGAALIYGDGTITPAISVLSAIEGLNVATASASRAAAS